MYGWSLEDIRNLSAYEYQALMIVAEEEARETQQKLEKQKEEIEKLKRIGEI